MQQQRQSTKSAENGQSENIIHNNDDDLAAFLKHLVTDEDGANDADDKGIDVWDALDGDHSCGVLGLTSDKGDKGTTSGHDIFMDAGKVMVRLPHLSALSARPCAWPARKTRAETETDSIPPGRRSKDAATRESLRDTVWSFPPRPSAFSPSLQRFPPTEYRVCSIFVSPTSIISSVSAVSSPRSHTTRLIRSRRLWRMTLSVERLGYLELCPDRGRRCWSPAGSPGTQPRHREQRPQWGHGCRTRVERVRG